MCPAAAYMPCSSPLTFPHRGPSTAGTSSGLLLAASIWRCCVFPVCAHSLSDGAMCRGPSIAGRTMGTRLGCTRDRERQARQRKSSCGHGHQEGQGTSPGKAALPREHECFRRSAAAAALPCVTQDRKPNPGRPLSTEATSSADTSEVQRR